MGNEDTTTTTGYKSVFTKKFTDISAKEKVLVKVIPEKETNTFYKRRLLNSTAENDTRKEMELLLTPPLIVSWTYQLAFALSEGCYHFTSNLYVMLRVVLSLPCVAKF